jgi:hypothetical protein
MHDLLIQTDDLFTKDAMTKIEQKRKVLEQVVDDLLKLPRGPQRWQEALKLYIQFNMSATDGLTAAEEVHLVSIENRKTRESLSNKFASSNDSNSDLRQTMNMPSGFKTLLNIVDPEINTIENMKRLRRTFPAFQIAEAI